MRYPVYVSELPTRVQREIVADLVDKGIGCEDIDRAMDSKIDDVLYALTTMVRKRVRMYLDNLEAANE